MPESECQSLQFDQLMAEGLNLDVEARWGAGFLPGRLQADESSWSYRAMARPLLDIAALIGYVRSTAWAFEDLDWGTATPRLQQLHALSRSNPIEAVSHRFVVLARPTVLQG